MMPISDNWKGILFMNDMNKSGRMPQLKNPFFTSNATNILMFFAGWGIWWSFFQIWLTTKQGFTGAQVGEIYSFNSAFSLIANLVYSNIQDRLGLKRNFDLLRLPAGVPRALLHVPLRADASCQP